MSNNMIVAMGFTANNKFGIYVFNANAWELYIEHEDIPNGKVIYGMIDKEDVIELYGLVNHIYDLLNYSRYNEATQTISTFVSNGLSFPKGEFDGEN